MSLAERFALAFSGVDLKTVSLHHPRLQAYAFNSHGHPTLLIRLPESFDRVVEGTRGLDVHVDPPGATNRFLGFQSDALGYTPMFEAVVDSLLQAAEDAPDEASALDRLLYCFEEFRQMFATRSGHLNESALRGLFAELLMLVELRGAGYSRSTVVHAWQGPYRVAKDFVLPHGLCIEVKSIRRVNHRVTIANVDQLDPRDEQLRLAVVPLERTSPEEGAGLLSLVSEVREWLSADIPSTHAFDEALLTLGFDRDDPWYEQWAFEAGSWAWFDVEYSFPRITVDQVPPAVTSVRYVLDIDQLGEFESDAFWHSSDSEDK